MTFLSRYRGHGNVSLLTAAFALLIVLAACGGGDGGTTTAADDAADTTVATGGTDTTEAADTGAGDDGAAQGGNVTIAWIPWEEDIALTNLWQVILEENGYTVEQVQLDAGLIYEGLATGDLDVFFDAWLPNTHADYWELHSENVADLGIWLEEAPLTWTVPAYLEDIDSIADLKGNADLFGGQIVGIEPSAGLTRISKEEVIPTYDLGEEYELLESSTPAMLAELGNAIANEEPIVVTLWRPHPAYGLYDLKDLEDPENALGDPDELHALASHDFVDRHPEIAEAIGNMYFEQDVLSALEVAVLEDVEEGEELQGARNWLEQNIDYVNAWLEGTGLSVGG